VLAAGANDCVVLPLQMKKGRAGVRVEALVAPAALEAVRGALFRGSSSIGLRWWGVRREALPRVVEERVEWRGQRVRVKRSRCRAVGERSKPEFEDVVRVAATLGTTPFEVYQAMLAEGVAAEG
jgi:pyridinium-3,5-bisthiocarboxylic acid mononucleotide nickel chelatase